MSYQSNNAKKTSIRINNPKISVRGNLVSIKEEKEQEEELVNSGISENYKNNLILVFVIVVTIVIVITGTVVITVYS